jgi:quinol monooxygenase YgiN
MSLSNPTFYETVSFEFRFNLLTGSSTGNIEIKTIPLVWLDIINQDCRRKEVVMNAKILIKRKFKPGKRREIIALLRELRSGALHQPGYISGETLTSTQNPLTMTVIGTWQDMESWYKWKRNSTRQTLEQMLETYQEESTVYEEYVLGAFVED